MSTPPLTQFGIQTRDGKSTVIEFGPGSVSAMVGPNGVGKSAIFQQIFRSMGGNRGAIWLTGNRNITFNSDAISVTASDVQRVLTEHFQFHQQLRVRDPRGGDGSMRAQTQLLIDREAGKNAEFRSMVRAAPHLAEKIEQELGAPIDDLNSLFARAAMNIRFIIRAGLILAVAGSVEFSVAEMSDGERSALLLALSVLNADQGTLILLDEPERHLNQSLAGGFVSAVLAMRPDCAFVVATHDLNLLEAIHADRIYIVRSSQRSGESWAFDIELIGDDESLNERARASILGGRRKVLFVEGAVDRRFFKAYYSDWDVRDSGGWETAVSTVNGLRNSAHAHWLRACAIIDMDGRSPAEVASLRDLGVYALSGSSIESIFCHSAIVSAVAQAKAEFDGGRDGDERAMRAHAAGLAAAADAKDEFCVRRGLWRIRRAWNDRFPSPSDLKTGAVEVVSIDCAQLVAGVTQEVELALQSGDLDKIVESCPIKHSSVPTRIATALGYVSKEAYFDAIIHHIDKPTALGDALRAVFVQLLPALDGN